MGVAEEALSTADAQRSLLQVTTGRVVALGGTQKVTVNVDGLEVTMANVGLDRPIVGDVVRVLYSADGTFLCLGSVSPRAAYGTVTVITGTTLTVLGVDGVTYSGLPYVTSYAPTLNDAVALLWIQNGLVLGKMSDTTAALAGGTVPAAPPAATSGTYTFQARGSGSYRTTDGRWWTNDVWYGSTNRGAWFYGSKIRDSLAGVRVISARIYLPVKQASGSELQLGVHDYGSQPGGLPAIASAATIPGVGVGSAWYTLPRSLAQYLVDNPHAGIGTIGPGLRVMTGRAASADSGKLQIVWRRS